MSDVSAVETPAHDVLICIPTYNEAGNIGPITSAILERCPQVHLLIIDDGSPDGTGQLADELARADERIHVMHRTEKAGLGRAYIAGFKWALAQGFEHVVEMDADFSHRPEDLPKLLEQLDHFDVVIGSRYVAGGATRDWGLFRRLLSRGGGFYARLVLGVDIRDLTAGFVAWRRQVLETIDLEKVEASGYVFQIELKYRAHQHGFRMVEVPIVFPDRQVGDSKMTPDIAAEALTRVWKIRLKR
ncbi:dolichyl-phosphate beta-D-mannosyltransferase [Lujinxingia litoralis]|uniref:Dolichyl-phosphate beta-D-mannosyltransferase n=1 Tax=Lujinxingia litoralis TaxID=2211119 RepID=A0A328C927_9DELT|nr:polyprenol monophosphomannose synthase [Lujinxingia litoralis]RAL24965.1 dolichyl-phosphate beta-D-mannosyltransferase [Lujinxingia litoralis]